MAKYIELNLTPKQVATLSTCIADSDESNGYQALKSTLSRANYAKLRAQSDEDGFISNNDLLWSIINTIEDDGGLDL